MPTSVSVTVLPETVQLPAAAKLTARPEEAVDVTSNGESLTALSASGSNVIVWSAFAIVRLFDPTLLA